MAKPVDVASLTGVARRFAAFVAERHLFALEPALAAFEAAAGSRALELESDIEGIRPGVRHELGRRLSAQPIPPGSIETTPRVTAEERFARARQDLVDECDGCL